MHTYRNKKKAAHVHTNVYTHIHTHLPTHVCMNTHTNMTKDIYVCMFDSYTNTYIDAHKTARTQTPPHSHIHVCTTACIVHACMRTHACTHIFTCVCISACTHKYMPAHKQTHPHTHSWTLTDTEKHKRLVHACVCTKIFRSYAHIRTHTPTVAYRCTDRRRRVLH